MELAALTAFLQTIVRQRSLSGQEQGVVQAILAEMKTLAYDRAWVDEYGNAVGIIEGSHPGPTLLLDAHCDVVDAIPSDWSRPPFEGRVEGDWLYGRGAADTKASLAAMLHAAASIDRAQLAGRVVVCATVSEEVMEGGSLKHVMDAIHPDFVVIGEATELNLNRGGRGRAEIILETTGRSAHSSSPQLGVCAIHRMLEVIHAIDQAPVRSHPLMGPALMVLTDILSEPYPGHSVIPNRCRASYDLRLLPGDTPESILHGIRALPALNQNDLSIHILAGQETTYTGVTMQALKFFPAWVFAEDHLFVQQAIHGLRRSGLHPEVRAYRFCTNAAYSAGVAGIPTIGFGPGSEGDAHTVDERISLTAVMQAAQGYRGIIQFVLAHAGV